MLEFHLFADDSNLFYKSNSLLTLQTNLNKELAEVYKWLCVNKLSLNIEKSNFVIFHPRQRKIETNVQIVVNQQLLKQELSIKYLGVTYRATPHPLVILQKRMIRIITFTNYYEHTSPHIKYYENLRSGDLPCCCIYEKIS